LFISGRDKSFNTKNDPTMITTKVIVEAAFLKNEKSPIKSYIFPGTLGKRAAYGI
jgi:hypothetical protein